MIESAKILLTLKDSVEKYISMSVSSLAPESLTLVKFALIKSI